MISVYYFGPLTQPGHHMYSQTGYSLCMRRKRKSRGRTVGVGTHARSRIHVGAEAQNMTYAERAEDVGAARRYACNSTFIANGIFTFEEMVALAKESFPGRWAAMKFEVRLYEI